MNTTGKIERGASIDIGTNSVKVWVAEPGGKQFPTTVHEEIKITKLGENQGETGRLSEPAMERTLQTTGSFAETARDNEAEQTIVCATSAVRKATNQKEFLERAQSNWGLNIRVLSGEQEAKNTFIGITYDWETRSDPISVFDVGGGSTELICGSPGKPKFQLSIPTGSVQLYEEMNWSGTLQKTDLKQGRKIVVNQIRNSLSPSERSRLRNTVHLIGAGGTVTTLAQVDMGAKDFIRERIERYKITTEQLFETAMKIANHTPTERVNQLHVRRGRKEYIVGGMVVVSGLLTAIKASEMYCTCRGLRHGLFLNEFVISGTRKPNGS